MNATDFFNITTEPNDCLRKLLATGWSAQDETKLTDILPPDQEYLFGDYLHNRNYPYDFMLETISNERAQTHTSPSISIDQALLRAVKSTMGTLTSGEKLAVLHYHASGRKRTHSRFAGIRFNPTGNEILTAERVKGALISFRSCLTFMVLLEYLGGGSFQLWAIADSFVKNSYWNQFLRSIVSQAELDAGTCEIFPDADVPGITFTRALRSPGSWNPHTGGVADILYHDLPKFVARVLGPSCDALRSYFGAEPSKSPTLFIQKNVESRGVSAPSPNKEESICK